MISFTFGVVRVQRWFPRDGFLEVAFDQNGSDRATEQLTYGTVLCLGSRV